MSHPISEALLEMRYFHLLVDHFRDLLGADELRILKPTPQKEKWLGYDQGYVKSLDDEEALEASLKSFIHTSRAGYLENFKAFFLQFKVVERRLTRRGIPSGWNKPWLAAAISTNPDKDTGISQHETLVRLAELPNTEVAYACPMLFDRRDLASAPSLETLRKIDVRSAPPGWLTSGAHKLAFQSPTSDAFWCSDPVEAKEWHFSDAFERLPELDEDRLQSYLGEVRRVVHPDSWNRSKSLPESLVVVGYS